MLVKMPISAGQGVLEMLQSRYPGYHPLMAIADIAHSGAADNDVKLQFDCHKTIAEYVLPKLRAVEHSGEVNQQRRVIVQLFQEDVEDAQLVESKGSSAQELLGANLLEAEMSSGALSADLLPEPELSLEVLESLYD